MKEELIFNLAYLLSVIFCAHFLFQALKKEPFNRYSYITNFYNNIYFTAGIVLFIVSLFIPDFFIQTLVVVISAALIFFMFYASLFSGMIEKIFKKVDFKIYIIHFIFQIILIFAIEKARGVY